MLVPKLKPCMSKNKGLISNLRKAPYICSNLPHATDRTDTPGNSEVNT